METKIEFIPNGTVTSPEGFCAGATYAGINKKAKHGLDLGILWSEAPGVATAVFRDVRVSCGGAQEIRNDVRRLTDRRLQAFLCDGESRRHERLGTIVVVRHSCHVNRMQWANLTVCTDSANQAQVLVLAPGLG